MTLKQSIPIPAGGATLEFQTAYDTEAGYDYFYVEVSTNAAASWQQLARWDGANPGFPAYEAKSFSLAGFANRNLLLRFRNVTDNYVEGAGVFVDEVVIRSTQVLLSDDAETTTTLWNYGGSWSRNSGSGGSYSHNYYLQWRNTGLSGGYDQALGDARGDPTQRIFNYPAFWRIFFYTGITQADTIWISVSTIILFFISAFLVPEKLSISGAVGMLFVLFSPASILLYERGNVDLFVFFVCAMAVFATSYSAYLATPLIVAASIMKLFPILGLSALLGEARKKYSSGFQGSVYRLLSFTWLPPGEV